MQGNHLLTLLLAIVLIITTYKYVDMKQQNKEIALSATTQREAVLAVIANRKSVRHFTQESIPEAELTTIVKAGMAAPSAGNKQPWSFIVVEDKELLNTLAETLPYAKMTKDAAAAIIVCGDMTKTFDGVLESSYWIQDCSAASENILLAVEAMGLGAVWTGVYPMVERTAKVQGILGIDAHLVPLNVIAIGHPKGETPPKDKWNEQNVIWKK